MRIKISCECFLCVNLEGEKSRRLIWMEERNPLPRNLVSKIKVEILAAARRRLGGIHPLISHTRCQRWNGLVAHTSGDCKPFNAVNLRHAPVLWIFRVYRGLATALSQYSLTLICGRNVAGKTPKTSNFISDTALIVLGKIIMCN